MERIRINKIQFKDLSISLKLSIIAGWIFFLEIAASFIYGFIIGFGM